MRHIRSFLANGMADDKNSVVVVWSVLRSGKALDHSGERVLAATGEKLLSVAVPANCC